MHMSSNGGGWAVCMVRTGRARIQGAVARSSQLSQRIACSRLAPHIASLGCNEPQTAGRSGRPKILQRPCSSS